MGGGGGGGGECITGRGERALTGATFQMMPTAAIVAMMPLDTPSQTSGSVMHCLGEDHSKKNSSVAVEGASGTLPASNDVVCFLDWFRLGETPPVMTTILKACSTAAF